MQRLFNVAKIGVFLDGYSPGTETSSAPNWDDGDAVLESEIALVDESRPTAKRGRTKKGRHDPDAEAAAQVAAGQAVN